MAEQIVLPFRLIRRSRGVKGQLANDDLVGLSYFDGVSDVVITGVCPSNPKHVRVERERDGKSWTVPAGLMRLIVKRKKRRRIA
ncbi:MAG TPA: hypothetical protein VGC91_08715 [Pyrinomonadaceae bacterium]